MKVTITSIELKGPFQFFILSTKAWRIVQQLNSTHYKDFKKKGLWTKHYTMTLWSNETEMKEFARSVAHLDAMKTSKEIAKEIRSITIDAESLPNWKDAMLLLADGKVIKYG